MCVWNLKHGKKAIKPSKIVNEICVSTLPLTKITNVKDDWMQAEMRKKRIGAFEGMNLQKQEKITHHIFWFYVQDIPGLTRHIQNIGHKI